MNFIYSEKKIAEKVGVSRYDMKNLRNKFLKENVDYKNLGGKRGGIGYTDGAVKSLVPHLPLAGIDLKECLLSAVPVLAEPPGMEILETRKGGEARESTRNKHSGATLKLSGGAQFIIVRIPPNPRLVLAKDEKGEIHRVFVGRNPTFVIGDKIDVEPWDGYWRFIGVVPRDRRRQIQRS